MGISIMPSTDNINALVKTFSLNTETYIVPSMYANNTTFLIGKYVDNKYGDTNGSLLAQVIYPAQNLTFPSNATADALKLVVYYSSIKHNEGVSFDVYQMKQQLGFRTKYYTDINADNYVDFSIKLGSIDLSIKDIANADTLIAHDTMPYFSVDFPLALAQKFMNESQYTDENTFKNFFKGIYIVPTDGSGATMLYAESVDLRLTYKYPTKIDEKDTILSKTLIYPANNEVRQVNKISHTNLQSKLNNKAQDREYIYSPAGFFTKLDIPVKEIIDATSNPDKKLALNSALIKIQAITSDDDLPLPEYLLLINQDSVQNFFEKNQLPNQKTNFYIPRKTKVDASNDTTYVYTFDLAYYIQKKMDDPLAQVADVEHMVLIPVKTTVSSSGTITNMENMIKLSGLTFKNQYDTTLPLKLKVVYNEFYKYTE